MAITWELKITPIDIVNKKASVRAVRTDDANPDNPMSYTVAKATIDTQAQKLAVLDEIWAKHQAVLAHNVNVNEFVSALEELGKANLEARE